MLFLIFSMTAISLELGDAPRNGGDDDERGLYSEAYLASPWLYIGPSDELLVKVSHFIFS